MTTKNGRATAPKPAEGKDEPKRLRQFSMYLPDDIAIVLRQAGARTNKSIGDLLAPILRQHLDEIRAMRSPRPQVLRLKRGRKIAT